MKQKRVSFNEKVEVKEFRKNDMIGKNKILENKGLIVKFVSIQIIFLLLIILNCKLNKYDKAWSYTTLTTACLVIYFIINYNYKILHFLHPIWVPLLTFLSLFLTNKYLLLESLWFMLVVQIAWSILDGCVLFEEKNEWCCKSLLLTKTIEIISIIATVILTYLICK